MHTCPIPGHGTTPIVNGSASVTVDGNPVACVGDKTGCGATIIEGAPLAIVDGDLIAFVGAKTDHGGTLISGSPSVMVGTGNVNGRDKTCIREK